MAANDTTEFGSISQTEPKIRNSEEAELYIIVESLADENERLREALKSVLGWRELRSHDEIPIGRIEEICTEALSTNEKPSGGEPKKRCLTDLGYRTPLPDSLLSDDGERRMAMRISPKEGE